MSQRSKGSRLDSLLSRKLAEAASELKTEAASLSPSESSSSTSPRQKAPKEPAKTTPMVPVVVGGCIPCQALFHCPRELLLHVARHSPQLLVLNPAAFTDVGAPDIPPLPQPPVQTSPQRPPDSATSSPVIQRKEATSLSYYMCMECSATFETRQLYDAHLRTHSPPAGDPSSIKSGGGIRCSECTSGFVDLNLYREHVRTAHGRGGGSLACGVCGEAFATAWELNRHQGSHTGSTHLCQHCGCCFRSRKALLGHIREHAAASPGSAVCADCGQELEDDVALEIHSQRAHPESRPFQCPFCDARFPFRKELETHTQKLHYLESFASGNTLAFQGLNRGNRESSVKSEGGSSGDGEVICPECGDALENRAAFRRHRRNHCASGAAPTPTLPSNPSAGGGGETGEEKGHSYPKYRAVSHNMANDYLNGLLEGIVQRPNPSGAKRQTKSRSESRQEDLVTSTTEQPRPTSSSPDPPTPTPLPEQTLPLNLSPLQNQYFRGLVESNVRKYNRQRIKDPLTDYMTTTSGPSSSPNAHKV